MSALNVLSYNAFGSLAACAATAAGWPGLTLPLLRISGFVLAPVVALDKQVARRRLCDGQGPQTDMSTLAVWEGWSADLGPMPPESALAIIGFISAAAPRQALYGLDVLAGYGAGLILAAGARRPSEWTMRECELAGVSLVWCRGEECECIVEGRRGPIDTARRTVATRQKEELLFSHAAEHPWGLLRVGGSASGGHCRGQIARPRRGLHGPHVGHRSSLRAPD